MLKAYGLSHECFVRIRAPQYFGYWVKFANEDIPPSTDLELQWTCRLRDMQKYVISMELAHVPERTTILKGDITAEIGELKRESGRDLMFICGALLYA